MQINPNTAKAYELLHQGILALARAERQGMRIDLDYAEAKREELTIKINKLQAEIEDSKFYRHWEHVSKGKPNLSSPVQLSNYLYNIKKIKPAILTESGQGSTNDEALKQLNIPELDKMLEARKLKKIRDTYLEAFIREQVNGFIHPQFNLHTVVSYRSSSDSPNFQNVPKRDKEAMNTVRNAIFAREGNQLMEVDFSGLEVSIAACYHKDPQMIKYLVDPHSDMHGDMASQIFCIDDFDKSLPAHKDLRYAAKNGFVFPQFYGDYYLNNAMNLCQHVDLPQGIWKGKNGIKLPDGTYLGDHLRGYNISCFNDFADHIQKIEKHFWSVRFKKYGQWKDKFYKEYLKNGFVDSHTGFRYKGEMRRNEVINYPVQGAAFHCLLWSLIRLDEIIIKRGFQSRIIGQIHDALVIDVYPSELERISKIVKKITTVLLAKEWDWINVPLSVDADLGTINGSWATLKHYELP